MGEDQRKGAAVRGGILWLQSFIYAYEARTASGPYCSAGRGKAHLLDRKEPG